MNILFAVHGYKPAYRIGGPIISVSELGETLARKGHSVTVFTTDSNATERLDVKRDTPLDVAGVRVWYFRTEDMMSRYLPAYVSQSLGFLYCPRMRSELDRIVPQMDIVHTHIPFVYPTYAAARAAARHHKPLVYHQRGVFDPGRLEFRGFKKQLYIAAVERPIMRQAAVLVALTEAEVSSYRALGVETPCEVVPNGIHVQQYRAEPSRSSRWRFPEGAIVILFLGRIHPLKGADQLLEAFLQIEERFPDAYLVIAGPDEFDLEATFRSRCEASPTGRRVSFPGMVSGEDKIDLLARADLFCLPSVGEGFSMAILEALASSTAVLISPGCHFDSVASAGVGIIAEKDARALAAALEQLLQYPSVLRRMGDNGRTFVSERYDWDSITEKMLAVYRGAQERAAG